MTDLATARAVERAEQEDAPEPAEPGAPERAEPSSAPAAGVELSRLLALARLSPPQAVEIGAAVLAEAVRRLGPESAGPGSGRAALGQVRIGGDGRLVPGSTGTPSSGGPAVAAVLAEVAGAARFRGRRADPAGDRLLAELDRAVADLPDAGVTAVAQRLAEAVGAIDRTAVRAELAALVRAVPGSAGSATGARTAGAPSTDVRATPNGRADDRGSRNTGRRIIAWLLSLLVLAGVVVVEVGVLRGKITTDIGLLLDAGRSGGTPSAGEEPADGLPVKAPAPASAGSVTAVDLRPLAQCAPGAPCTLRLLVRLAPRADPQVVTWSYLVVDRCTGATSSAPGGTVTVPPNAGRAVTVGTVVLPDLPGVAVVAVTDSPAAASSSPVSVGSCRRTG